MYAQSPYDISSAQNVILLITFVVEFVSGAILVLLGIFKIKAGGGGKKAVASFIEDPLARPGFQQMIIMGLVDMFSSLCCFMKVTANTMYGESEWLTYLQFGVCTPPMIVVLCMVCSVDNDITLGLAIIQGFIIMCGYVGTVATDHVQKYAWFIIGAVLFVFQFGVMIYMKRKAMQEALLAIQSSPALAHSRQSRKKKDLEEMAKRNGVVRDQKLSNRLIVITLATWSLYPVTWLVIENDTIDHSTADIVHSALAFVAKVTFGYVLAYYRSMLGYDTMMSTVLPTFNFGMRGNSNKDMPSMGDSTAEVPNVISLDASSAGNNLYRRPSVDANTGRRQSVDNLRKSAELKRSIELMRQNDVELKNTGM